MSKMRKHFLLWCWHFSELWYWWHCVVEPVMMIDLTGSLKEMSKFVLKAVFVAWNCNCKRRYRLLLKNSIKMLVVGKEHQQEKVEIRKKWKYWVRANLKPFTVPLEVLLGVDGDVVARSRCFCCSRFLFYHHHSGNESNIKKGMEWTN